MADVAFPNYGVASGLAEGLKQGLITYQNQKNIQHQNQMQELLTGMQKNPQTGELELNPLKQQQQQAQGLLAQRSMDELDPNSDVSQRLGGIRGQILHNANPKAGADIYSGTSAADQKEIDPLVKSDVSGQYGLLKQLYNPLTQVKQGQLDVARDNQASSAVDKITNDAQLKAHTQRIQGADRILSQLDDVKHNKIVDTHQLLNDVNTEYVALLTGSNNPALGKQERTEYTSKASQLSALIQDITAHPESINSPDIMNQLETQVRGLKTNYQGQVSARAKLLKRSYAHNPIATQAQQDKILEMQGQFGQQQEDSPQGLMLGAREKQVTPHPQDEAAVAWAKAHPKDPQSALILKANGVSQ